MAVWLAEEAEALVVLVPGEVPTATHSVKWTLVLMAAPVAKRVQHLMMVQM